jgi:hypothetical protein
MNLKGTLQTPRGGMCAYLIVFRDGEKTGARALDRERLRIGRHPGCDLVLPHGAVSGEHAVVITVRDESFLEDMRSTNGTWVNGHAVNKHALAEGDEIGIAPYVLKYTRSAANASLAEKAADRPAAGRPPADASAGQGEEAACRAVDESFPLATLLMLGGPSAGMEIALWRALSTLGKPGVQMATIARQAGGYSLSPLEGESLPRVNGAEISPGGHVLLGHLDDVEIAGVRMKFMLQRTKSPE